MIRNFFLSRGLLVEITGKKDASKEAQIDTFISALERSFFPNLRLARPESWKQAFELITRELEQKKGPITIFFDELPWLATKRSGLLAELDYYWNTRWSKIKDLKIILCGSAAAWMLDKLVQAKGGLHNRITHKILLKPFSLAETQMYLVERKIYLSKTQILELYMAIGGIPYYLDWLTPNLSPTQLLDRLCFSDNGPLLDEYDSLLSSLFNDSLKHESIVRHLAKRRYGLSAKELSKLTGISTGNAIERHLRELSSAGFIRRYVPFGYNKRNSYYRLIDEYTLFYLRWIEPIKTGGIGFELDHWVKQSQSSALRSWSGYSFETLCFKHYANLLKALSIAGMSVNLSTWQYIPEKRNALEATSNPKTAEQGAQIDMVLDRADKIINLCEIKYTNRPWIMKQEDVKKLQTREAIFASKTKTNRPISTILISANGLIENQYSRAALKGVVTGEELF